MSANGDGDDRQRWLPAAAAFHRAAKLATWQGRAMLVVTGVQVTVAVAYFARYERAEGGLAGFLALLFLGTAALYFSTARTHRATAAIYDRLAGRE